MDALAQSLHIVAFDVPYPANYGGVIDVYFKLVWLKKMGVKIHLHCFNYGRKQAPELESLCEKVSYYSRKTGLLSSLGILPYNVRSRTSLELEHNLLLDDHPVMFEVLHTCYLMSDPRFKNRKKIYRHSNIEHEYYAELSGSERNFLKKIYLKIEAIKLKRFESVLNFADVILAVNQKDTDYFRSKYPKAKSFYLPSFHPNDSLKIQNGTGKFALFHGNLGVSENYEAAAWLIKEVFSKLEINCVIAGLNPPKFLTRLVANYKNISLVANPVASEMLSLTRDAQIHMLCTAQPTGLKLKLLNVLFNGRFIICNSHMLAGTGISENDSLFICDSAGAFIQNANALKDTTFSETQRLAREQQIEQFDNDLNCKKMIRAVF